MSKKRVLLLGGILAAVVYLGLNAVPNPRMEEGGVRLACNDDAAGLLIQYLAKENGKSVEVVEMSFQQLQDCCSSQTELALAGGNFDLAVLCPDSAAKLLAAGQPYVILGPVVRNACVLVSARAEAPRTVGYMNARERQKTLVWSNVNEWVEMKPILPAGLPYALERNAVEGIVLDILGALKIEGYRRPLPAAEPDAVLVGHQDLLGSPALNDFLLRYNQAAVRLNRPEVLGPELTGYLGKEDGGSEVGIWQQMGVQFQTIEG